MKKLLILNCFCMLLLFITCKHDVSSIDYIENEELSDIEKKELYLNILMETGNYRVDEEKIEKDLVNILQNLQNNSAIRNVSVSTPIIEKIEETSINTKDIIPFSTEQEQTENIKLYIHKIANEEKKGFAITCNDLRIGEILAIIEEGEFKKDITNDSFMKVIATNIDSYITSTLQNWEKLKKGKETSRSAFRDMVESNNYTYSNWTLLNGNLNNILKTKWNQMKPYNRVINELIGGNFPSGCVTTAIAQVMAFHEYPPSYVGYAHKDFRYFKNEIKNKIPAIENWYGRYDWKEIKKNEYADYVSEEAQLQIASLMYEIAQSAKASYSRDGTGILVYRYPDALLPRGYFTGTRKSNITRVDIGKIGRADKVIMGNNNGKNKHHMVMNMDYSFKDVKYSIDGRCPLITRGDSFKYITKRWAFWWEWEEVEYGGGHAWVTDGYCKLSCDAKNHKTNEKVRLTLDYVHCNPGWGGTSNGYYISDIFSFNLGANASDYEIKSDKEGYYKYEIKIFPELIPETRLNFDLFFDWYPL